MTAYQIIRFTNHQGGTCEHCGKDITNIFTITGDGITMQVGSSCVNQFLDDHQNQDATRITKRAERAARQWRDFHKGKPAPAPLTDETREQYINRRVEEMSRALQYCTKAQAEVTKAAQRYRGRGHYPVMVAYRLLRWADAPLPRIGEDGYSNRFQLVSYLEQEANRRWKNRIARKYGVNAYDVFQPIWKVRAI